MGSGVSQARQKLIQRILVFLFFPLSQYPRVSARSAAFRGKPFPSHFAEPDPATRYLQGGTRIFADCSDFRGSVAA
jgi:hypothetical protein